MAKSKEDAASAFSYWRLRIKAPSGRVHEFCGAGDSLKTELITALTAEGWSPIDAEKKKSTDDQPQLF